MNLDPRTVVILTVLSTLLMSMSLFAVARGYLAEMRGVTRWASGTLLQSIGWILLALLGLIPSFVAELGSPFIMMGLALYYHALIGFKGSSSRVSWVYVVVCFNVLAIYYFLLISPNMAARIVVASSTAAVLMFASARLLFSKRLSKLPISHSMTGILFAFCSVVLAIRAVYYLVWNTAPDQSAFEQNIVQDIAFLTFFLAGVVSPFTFILMCNDRYNDKALQRTQELAKKNIELEEASRAKGQFLATMSHELRTPLNGVIGFLKQLGKTSLDDQQKDYLHTVDLSARMLLGVINDVLDYSKIEAGKLAIEEIGIDLRKFLDETISIFAVSAEDKGLDLVCVVDRKVPDRLLGDPLRLTQVLSNLLGNAIKFTNKGEVLLEIRLIEETDSDVSLEMRVSDTGIGISQASLDQLFQPFVQADASTTRKHGGTGLGLIIARRLIDMMGGSIKVESEVSLGTRFTIHLSLPKQEGVLKRAQGIEDLSLCRLLTVTPNANVARSFAEAVAVWGMTTQTASSGLAALEIIKAANRNMQTFDAVVFDLAVKDMLPREFSEKIIADTSLNSVDLLLLSSISFCQKIEDIKKEGFCGCICKPVKCSEIYKELARLFAHDPKDNKVSHSLRPEGNVADIGLNPLSGKRLLIVDDNYINRKLVQLLVGELGGEFDTAENGAEAVEACSRKSYDLILMDVNMPVMDGLEATRRIRALESSSSKVLIIALTANALPGDKEKFIAAGMDDYLSKPINENSLLSILNHRFPQVDRPLPENPGEKYDQKEMGNTTPALDPVLGVKLSFGDPLTWHMVLGLLLDDLEDYSSKLKLASNDRVQLSYISHKLAGASCYCGTPALHHAAKQVEIHCSQDNVFLFKDLLSQLQFQIERLLRLDAAGKLRGSEVVVY